MSYFYAALALIGIIIGAIAALLLAVALWTYSEERLKEKSLFWRRAENVRKKIGDTIIIIVESVAVILFLAYVYLSVYTAIYGEVL